MNEKPFQTLLTLTKTKLFPHNKWTAVLGDDNSGTRLAQTPIVLLVSFGLAFLMISPIVVLQQGCHSERASSGHIQITTISLTSILLDTTKLDQNRKEVVSFVHGSKFGHFKGIFDLEICGVPNSL